MPEKPTYEELEQRVRELEIADLERKQVVKVLREREEIFKCFLENSPIYIFFKDRQIRSVMLSKNYEKMIGKPLDDILGKTMDDLFPSEIAKKMIVDDQKILNEGKTVVVDETLNGRYYTTEKFPIFINGQASYLAGYTIDITEQKLAEDALRNSEAQLRDRNYYIQTILDNLPIGLAVNKIDEGSAIYINKQFEDIYGWPAEEIESVEAFFERVYPDPDYRKIIIERVLTDMASGDPDRMQWDNIQVTAKDGSTRFISAKNIPLVEQNLMISTVMDVTKWKEDEAERENLQAQLNQAQKMESVGRLAGGVAHDFNNMLMVIIGYADLAMNQVAPDDPMRNVFREILKAASRSANVAKQLLAFARKQTIVPKVLDLNSTVEGMLKMLRRLIGEDITLTWLPRPHVWRVKIDPSQLDQILANLCVNARDAIADVGKITIETGSATFDAEYCADNLGFVVGEYSLLAVSDDGSGMDKQTQDRLFEPFFTTKGVGKGTGLGLATVYGIVKQNGGFINVYSEPNQGTTFKIYFPRFEAPEEKSDENYPKALKARGNETVLLVEDDPTILKLSKIMLENLGYSALVANTPRQAIDFAHEHKDKVHLLLTDVVMPEMNGRDLAAELLLFYPELKVVFMSGYTADVIVHHGVLDKGVNFIQKPFSLDDLAVKLREALDKE